MSITRSFRGREQQVNRLPAAGGLSGSGPCFTDEPGDPSRAAVGIGASDPAAVLVDQHAVALAHGDCPFRWGRVRHRGRGQAEVLGVRHSSHMHNVRAMSRDPRRVGGRRRPRRCQRPIDQSAATASLAERFDIGPSPRRASRT